MRRPATTTRARDALEQARARQPGLRDRARESRRRLRGAGEPRLCSGAAPRPRARRAAGQDRAAARVLEPERGRSAAASGQRRRDQRPRGDRSRPPQARVPRSDIAARRRSRESPTTLSFHRPSGELRMSGSSRWPAAVLMAAAVRELRRRGAEGEARDHRRRHRDRARRREGAEDGRQLRPVRQGRPLRRHGLPPRDPRTS